MLCRKFSSSAKINGLKTDSSINVVSVGLFNKRKNLMIKDQSLPSVILNVIRNQATEPPNSGTYHHPPGAGTYLCRGCGLALFRVSMQFDSHCGWPSFDEYIPNAIAERLDKDGKRMEIVCARCHAHLGHVFYGESLTDKNIRHCVNSISLDFIPNSEVLDTEEAIVAGGCFWGVEHYLRRLTGVLRTEVGYTGGHQENPAYDEVCSGLTGHVEAVRVLYDPQKISYEDILRHFFEIHDPTQQKGQGPDIGSQYLSMVYYYDTAQKTMAEKLIQLLKKHGYAVVTKLLPISIFWPAETYHQSYYEKTGKNPYCHKVTKRF